MMVNFPDAVWGRLASIADNRGVKIADLIAASAMHVLGTPTVCTREHVVPRPIGRPHLVDRDDPTVTARILRLRELHRSVEAIAAEFGVSPSCMRDVMRHLKIPTNSRKTNDEGGRDA